MLHRHKSYRVLNQGSGLEKGSWSCAGYGCGLLWQNSRIWGEVTELSFGPGLDDQYTFETFYRWQTTEQLALTADFQYLRNPALNPDEDGIYVLSFRARFAL